jgi:hypothetical protein
MLVLGLVLVVVSAGAGVLLISFNSAGGPEQMVTLFGRDLGNVNALQAFIAGLVVALVFCLGLWLVARAERQRRAVRSEYRAVRREARAAVAERDQLARELERERAATVEPASAPAEWNAPAKPAERTEPVEREPRGIGRHFRRTQPAGEQAAANTDK